MGKGRGILKLSVAEWLLRKQINGLRRRMYQVRRELDARIRKAAAK